MEELLLEALNQNKIVSVYTNAEDTSHFNAGIVRKLQDGFFLLEETDPTGKEDGFAIFDIQDIVMLSSDGQYEKRIQKIMEVNPAESRELPLLGKETDSLNDRMLNYAIKNKRIVSFLFIDREDISGFVKGYTDEIIEIEVIDFYGNRDGQTAIRKELIQRMRIMTADERALEKIM